MNQQTTILIVDDHDMIVKTLEAMLSVENYRLQRAENGFRALEMVQAETPDLVLLDLMMPRMTGFEVCTQLRARKETSQMPIIVLSALADRRARVSAMEAGADDFITKPVAGVELRARIRTMLRIRKQNVELQQLMLRRDLVTHMIIHDFRSPLALIAGAAESIGADSDLSTRSAANLARIQDGLSRLTGLVDQILLLGKSESGRLQANRVACDVSELVQSTVLGAGVTAARRSISILSTFPDGVVAEIDSDLVRRSLENLLSNALKYTPSGECVEVGGGLLAGPGSPLVFRVVDGGPGVPEALRESIFAPYFSSEPNTPHQIGVGLGLPFCRMVAELHGGSIRVEPNALQGSVFTMTIPPVPLPVSELRRESEPFKPPVWAVALRRMQTFGPAAMDIGIDAALDEEAAGAGLAR